MTQKPSCSPFTSVQFKWYSVNITYIYVQEKMDVFESWNIHIYLFILTFQWAFDIDGNHMPMYWVAIINEVRVHNKVGCRLLLNMQQNLKH